MHKIVYFLAAGGLLVVIGIGESSVSSRVLEDTEPNFDVTPVVEIRRLDRTHARGPNGRPPNGLILAAWSDGRVIWSNDLFQGGPPFWSGEVDSSEICKALAIIDSAATSLRRSGSSTADFSVCLGSFWVQRGDRREFLLISSRERFDDLLRHSISNSLRDGSIHRAKEDSVVQKVELGDFEALSQEIEDYLWMALVKFHLGKLIPKNRYPFVTDLNGLFTKLQFGK
jgi:hypothetical protein